MTNRMILYARVSSSKQEDNTSLESQVERMREYCRKEAFHVSDDDIFREVGSAGGGYTRPEFRQALERMKSEDCDGLVVIDIDRFFRNVAQGICAYKEHFEGTGRRLISLQQNIDTGTPEGWLMFVMFLSMAEYATKKDARRMREGYNRAKQLEPAKFMGGALGYGQEVQEGLKVEVESPVLDFVREGLAKGWNVSTITTQLNYSELKPKAGKRFYKSTVGGIVERLQA